MTTEMATEKTPTRSFKSYDKVFIGGKWVTPTSTDTIEIVSPFSEQTIGHVPAAHSADISAAVGAARAAFDDGPWPHLPPSERGQAISRLVEVFRSRGDEMAETLVNEIGATVGVAKAQVARSLTMWEDAATFHERFVFEDVRESFPGTPARLTHEPVGVVGAIIPWNGPIPCASIKLGGALAAGCTVVLKAAPEAPVSPMLLAEFIEEADLPPGVVSVVAAGREESEHLVTDSRVDKIAFTGSTAAGKRIMALCAERIARVGLELGGKSAGIVADDIDVERLVPSLVPGSIGHSGQVCNAITRLLVPRARQSEVTSAIAEAFRSLTVGDPSDPSTSIGPLIAERQRNRVEEYIRIGIQEGANLAAGGGRPTYLKTGWFVEPTLFSGVTADMRVAQEEIFGPVLVILPYDTHDEAIEIANGTLYGLAGSVYADDVDLAVKLARRMKAGQIAINNAGSCITQPVGGFKQSGLGREGGVEGMAEYLESRLISGA
jgi:aldehyde dehydrogenase (NAD+)